MAPSSDKDFKLPYRSVIFDSPFLQKTTDAVQLLKTKRNECLYHILGRFSSPLIFKDIFHCHDIEK